MNIFVFDIETVPDIELAKKIYDLNNLGQHDVIQALFAMQREKNGSEFLPHFLQKVISISMVWAKNSKIKIFSLGNEQSDESELISKFFNAIDKYTPTLVSWNGSGFDLPVLHYRSLINKISAPTYWEHGEQNQNFKWNNYLSRYHYRHLDLMDVLAGYQPKCYAPLSEIAISLGFPGKMGMSGAQVLDYYLAGDLSSIRNYCETDVINTYCVYLRFELMRGKILLNDYETLIANLKDYLITDPSKQHFNEFALAIT